MSFETLSGIVLRYTDYRDNDRILTLLTKERGLVSVTARAVRAKSKSDQGLVKDAYCYGEFVVYERNGIEYVSASSVIEAFYPIREDYDRLVAAAQTANIAHIVADGHSSGELFSLLYHTLSFIAYTETDPHDLVLCFLAKSLSAAGYEPLITRCAGCGKSVLDEHSIAFSNTQGGSLCSNCRGGEKTYSPLALELIRRMLILPDYSMHKVRLKKPAGDEIDKLLFSYAEFVLERSVRLKNSARTE